MTDLIMKMDGTIDKYMGDCIMAFWNAPIDCPDHAYKAVKTAVLIKKRLKELNQENAFGHEIKIGIGINSGEALVGNMGSDQRFDYSVIGDAVNLASRLEGTSKNYDTTIIIGEETVKRINKPKWAFRLVDKVQVKGKSEKVSIYTV